MRRADQAKKMLEISAQFVTDPQLVFPFRYLVKEGMLVQQTHSDRGVFGIVVLPVALCLVWL
jgi:hypothetical protein